MSRVSAAKRTGDATELLVAYWLTRAGITVSWPFGDTAQYDLIATIQGEPLRIQCKTGKRTSGSLTWSCMSHGSNGNHNYRGDADMFGVSDLVTGKAYLIPVCTCGTRRGTLRIDPLKDGRKLQALGWAVDYEIAGDESYGIKALGKFMECSGLHQGERRQRCMLESARGEKPGEDNARPVYVAG